MWEEDPRYQQAQFRQVVIVVVAGTALLAILCRMADDFAPLKTWVTGLLLVEGAWLVIAAAVYIVVRLWFWRSGRRAKFPGHGTGP